MRHTFDLRDQDDRCWEQHALTIIVGCVAVAGAILTISGPACAWWAPLVAALK